MKIRCQEVLNLIYLLVFVCMITSGCGQTDNNLKMMRNEELGVEIPENVYTEWQVEDKGDRKVVIFYSNPYKKDNPPYIEGTSPDIESVICINNYDSTPKDKRDKFEGVWLTGLNEGTQSERKISSKIDRNNTHFLSAIRIIKDSAGKYKSELVQYTILSSKDKDLKKIKDPISSILFKGGYESWLYPFRGDVEVNGDIIKVHFFMDNGYNFSNPNNAYIEMLYHYENDTLEVIKLDTDTDTMKDVFLDFGLRSHNDILKRYKYEPRNDYNSPETEVLSGLVQIKMDQIKEAHPEYTGYKNLMLKYKHEAVIPKNR